MVIGYSKHDKHALPVNAECAYAHKNSVPKIGDGVCRRDNDLPVDTLVSEQCVEAYMPFFTVK